MSEIKPVAYIYTPFPSKFGVPRQSGIVNTIGKIILEKEYRFPDAVRGLDGFSYLWLIWEFSETKDKRTSLTVRPPRLGGNKRMGVFATRSPFRPNSLGLSSVRLEKIDYNDPEAPVIYVKGADIVNGTPIFDIKPYVPYSDSHPDAKGGFSDIVLNDYKKVIFPDDLRKNLSSDDILNIEGILSGDPIPHYQNDPERIYSFEFSCWNIKFKSDENTIKVISLEKIKDAKI